MALPLQKTKTEFSARKQIKLRILLNELTRLEAEFEKKYPSKCEKDSCEAMSPQQSGEYGKISSLKKETEGIEKDMPMYDEAVDLRESELNLTTQERESAESGLSEIQNKLVILERKLNIKPATF